MPTAQTTTLDRPAHKPKYKRLTDADRALILQLHSQDKTQTQIAQVIGCNQSSVSDWLKQMADTSHAASTFFRAQAMPMAKDIVKHGRPADKVAVLKGIGVLANEQASGVTVIVGGGGQVNVGIMLSPPSRQLESEGVQISSVNVSESDK